MNMKSLLAALAAASLLAGCVSEHADGRKEVALPTSVKCVGHRGDYPDAPEGSRPAYSNAVVRGCDILKLDLQETRDGVPVLSHDATLARTMGWSTNISAVTYADILKHTFKPVGGHAKETIVTVEEGLRYAKNVPETWLDFKHFDPAFCEKVLDLVAEAGIVDDRVMCATYSRRALAYLKEKHPKFRRVGHMDFAKAKDGAVRPSFDRAAACRGEDEVVKAILAYRDELGLWGVNICAGPVVTPSLVRRLRLEGLWVSVALVHTAEAARTYAPAKPNCVVTRDVRTVRPIFDACLTQP